MIVLYNSVTYNPTFFHTIKMAQIFGPIFGFSVLTSHILSVVIGDGEKSRSNVGLLLYIIAEKAESLPMLAWLACDTE